MNDQRYRLSVIMFSDIVGYTSLMGRDEQRGIELLRRNRQIHSNLIKKYDGVWIKEMGDGMLVRFDSAYNAARCAIDIQRDAKKDLGAQLRIGLHLGEILIENEDVFGDGVNVASRIESLAEPGAIYISESIHKSLQSNAEVHSSFLGPVHLKNVEYQVKIYYITNDGIATPSDNRKKEIIKGQNQDGRRMMPALLIILAVIMILTLITIYFVQNKAERRIRSIAVLPFANSTGNEDEQYFVDMMHRAVIHEVSKIEKLKVTSRTSTMRFRDTNMGVPEIAKILNVDAVIESSVFKTSDSVLLQVQLIQARPEERSIWSQELERDTRYIFSLYGELARAIAEGVEVELTPEEIENISLDQEVDPIVYKTYQNGQYNWLLLSKEGIENSKKYFDQVLEMEPNHALAHAGLAIYYVAYAQQGHVSFFESGPLADFHAKKALELNDQLPDVYLAAAFNAWIQWELDDYITYFRKALELNPNSSEVLAFIGQALVIEGFPAEANKNLKKAMELDPLNDTFKALYTMSLYFTGKYDEAYSFINDVIDNNPEHPMLNSSKRAVLHAKEMYEEEYHSWLKKYSLSKDSLAVKELKKGYESGGYKAAIQNLIHHLTWKSKYSPEYVSAWQIATLYARIEDRDKTLNWLNRAYDLHSISLPFILIDPLFGFLKEDPEFLDIVRRLKSHT